MEHGSSPAPSEPRQIGRYKVLRRLGEGGMGVVYLAEDMLLLRQVAVKLARAGQLERGLQQRLLQEARAASRLTHSNIAGIYDCGETEDGRLYIVMELVSGTTLSELLAREGAQSLARSLDILEGLLAALEEAHSRHLLHRDIKPANIVLTDKGGLKLLDFGLALPITGTELSESEGDRLTLPGTVVGSPGYMSPEQVRAQPLDERSDLFSAAVVFYYCLTGQAAFRGVSNAEVMGSVLHAAVTPPSHVRPGIPQAVDSFTLKALSKPKEERFWTAGEMRHQVQILRHQYLTSPETVAGASQETLSAPSTDDAPARRSDTLTLSVDRMRLRWSLAGLALVAMLGLAWMQFRPKNAAVNLDARQWFERGTSALRDGTYYSAARALEKAASLDQQYPLIPARLAEAYAESDQGEKAKEIYLKATGLAAGKRLSSADRQQMEAIRCLLTRDYSCAVSKFEELGQSAAPRERAQFLVDLGRSYEKLASRGKPEMQSKAQESYRQAVALDPNSAAAHLRLGVLLGKLQQADVAEEEFRRAEALYEAASTAEGRCEVAFQRGLLLSKGRDVQAAVVALERARDLAAASGIEYYRIRSMLQLSMLRAANNDTEGAQKLAQQAVDLARQNAMPEVATRGLVDLGQTVMMRNEKEKAESLLREAAETAQKNGQQQLQMRAFAALSNLLNMQGRAAEAAPLAQKAREYYSAAGAAQETGLLLALEARAAQQTGRYADALARVSELKQQAEQAKDDLLRVLEAEVSARLMTRLERMSEAIVHADRYYELALNPKIPAIHKPYAGMLKADLLLRVGDEQGARRMLEQTAKLLGTSGSTAGSALDQTKARLNESLGRYAEARPYYEGLLKQDNSPGSQVDGHLNLAIIALRSGKTAEARKHLTEALAALPKIGDPYGAAQLKLTDAETRIAEQHPEQAVALAEESLQFFEEHEQWHSAWRTAAVLSEAYRKIGKPAEAEAASSKGKSAMEKFVGRLEVEHQTSYKKLPETRFYLQKLG